MFRFSVCLSTVDRRSRERFLESNHQIAALVEKFKIEGGIYRKTSINGPNMTLEHGMIHGNKVPLLLGRIGAFQVAWTIYLRLLVTTLSFRKVGLKQMFLRLFLLPLYFGFMWLFFREMQDFQHTFITRNGLILNCLCGAYFLGIINTILLCKNSVFKLHKL